MPEDFPDYTDVLIENPTSHVHMTAKQLRTLMGRLSRCDVKRGHMTYLLLKNGNFYHLHCAPLTVGLHEVWGEECSYGECCSEPVIKAKGT